MGRPLDPGHGPLESIPWRGRASRRPRSLRSSRRASIDPSVLFGLGFGVAFVVGWFLFALPLYFEAPHPVHEICRGNCGDFSTAQYGVAEPSYSIFFGSLAVLGFAMALYQRHRLNRRQRDAMVAPESPRDPEAVVGPPLPRYLSRREEFAARDTAWNAIVERNGPLKSEPTEEPPLPSEEPPLP